MEWKKYFRVALVALLLYSFYVAGFPILYIPLMGIIFILLIFLRGTFYRKIDEFLIKRLPFVAGWPSWVKKLLIIAIFILIYALFKQILFLSLKIVGIDIEQMILEGVNASLKK